MSWTLRPRRPARARAAGGSCWLPPTGPATGGSAAELAAGLAMRRRVSDLEGMLSGDPGVGHRGIVFAASRDPPRESGDTSEQVPAAGGGIDPIRVHGLLLLESPVGSPPRRRVYLP